MLKYYVKRSSGEAFQRIQTPPKDNVWIHGDSVTHDELHSLARTHHLNANILRDVLDKNELPRVETQDGALYVFVRMVQRGKHGKITTTPVLLVVKGTVFANLCAAVTDRTLAIPSANAAKRVDTNGQLLETFATILSEYEDLMQLSGRYVHDTGQRLRTHEVTNDDFIKFVTIENNLNEYLMNLNSMLVVAQRLKETLKDSDDTEAVEDIVLYIRQLVVSIQSHTQNITSIRNAYGTIANNVLNQRMKTLTVLTVLIALPNVVYGMYGMNVNLPFQEEPWVYGIIVAFSMSIIVLVFLIGRKKGVF